MYLIKRQFLAKVPKCLDPRFYVKIIRVYERAVYIKDHGSQALCAVAIYIFSHRRR
jgi:hypothetical protein